MTTLDVVKTARAKWANEPDKLRRAHLICNTVCNTLGAGWGIFHKTGGIGYRRDGKIFSLDLIFNRITKTAVDVLKDAENTAEPVWQVKTIGKLEDWEKAWTAPYPEPTDEGEDPGDDSGDGGEPGGDPTKPPAGPSMAELMAQLRDLETRSRDRHEEQRQWQEGTLRILDSALKKLDAPRDVSVSAGGGILGNIALRGQVGGPKLGEGQG